MRVCDFIMEIEAKCELETPKDEVNVEVEPAEAKNDPYAYLNREFSSENYKIEIKNLPRFYGVGELKKLLNDKLNLNSNKVKTPRKNSVFAFACFRNDEDRETAIKTLNGYKWKGKVLNIIKAKPAPDPLVRKRKDAEEDEGTNKKAKHSDKTQAERLILSTIPLADTPYEEQLNIKQEEVKRIMKKIGNDLYHFNPEVRSYLEKQKKLHNGLPCELLKIKHSDQIDEYRNKCEFSVGIDEETNLPTVGFRIGSYANGITGVGSVETLKHIPKSMKVAVKVFQEFVRSSKLEVFNAEFQTGNFRQLTARSAPNQLMLIVGYHPQNLSKEELNNFNKELIEFFLNGSGKDAHVTSLYTQKIVKKTNHGDYISPEHLMGDTHIYETLLGLKFKISPEAFFQVNTSAAEILYQTAIDLANCGQNTTVLDICCGTGTIGLCFSKSCSQVLGIEIIPQAIEDAKQNAEANNVKNAEFYAGKAEETLGNVCYRATNQEVVAVLDPPRAGIHQKGILQIRKIRKINKLIYIACNPAAAHKNFVDLGRPESKTVSGDVFLPVKAVAVDLFPHTKHCELIISFERWENIKKNEIKTEENQEENSTNIEDSNDLIDNSEDNSSLKAEEISEITSKSTM